jgi:hypothetical protein
MGEFVHVINILIHSKQTLPRQLCDRANILLTCGPDLNDRIL